jgi:hypothetical protein
MTGYKVKPRGVVSQFKHGGFVVYEENGHGLVAAISDLGFMDWNSARTKCDELILNGYSDWHLPSKEELNSVYVNLKLPGVGGFGSSGNWEPGWIYWSSTDYHNGVFAWTQNLKNGRQDYYYDYSKYKVRAVRTF